MDVLTRSVKLLVKDGLTFLAEEEEAGFKGANIKEYIAHYLQEVFQIDQFSHAAQNIWDFVTEHARKKFAVTVERDVLQKVHLTALLMNLCSKLNIRLRVDYKDIDFYNPPFLSVDDIISVNPVVKDYRLKVAPLLQPYERFPSSLNLVLEAARTKDRRGKRSQWNMPGSPERADATELFRMACSICEQIYGQQTINYAKMLKEFATHLESRHQEGGRPENSRWNRSAAILEDDLSMEARYFFQISLKIIQELVSGIESNGCLLGKGILD